MDPFSTATAAVFVRYWTFTRRARRCGGFHYWRITTHCYLFLVLYNVIRVFFNVSLQNFIFFFKRTSTFFNSKRKQTLYPESAYGRCSVKRCYFSSLLHVMDIGFARKGYSRRRQHFSQSILLEIRTGLFSKEVRCYCAINKFRTGTLCRIISYLTEHLKVPCNYR